MPSGTRPMCFLDGRVTLTPESLQRLAGRVAAHMEQVADELNTADGQLGDGDLGVTMVRGCRLVVEALAEPPADVGATLARCAQAFTKTSGSSFGTLVATGLLAAARLTKGRNAVPLAELPALLQAALDAMRARGKACLGDKTVLDGLDVVREAVAALPDSSSAETVTAEARRAAAAALEAFRERPNRVGRARIFGERSIGLDDPGMLALLRVLDAV